MNILVTGCAGFVGSQLINRISGRNVVGVDNLQFGYADNINPDVNWTHLNFRDLSQDVLDQYDVLVHLATANIIYAMNNCIDTYRTNSLDTIGLFRRFKGKIIYTSTASVYGQALQLPTPESADIMPYNAYDMSKRIAELYLQKRGNYTTLRLSNVYGPGQRSKNPYCGVVGKFITAARTTGIMNIYGNGCDTRDYTYIDDVLDAICSAIERPAMNTEINIGSGAETSIIKVAWEVAELSGIPLKIIYTQPRSIDRINRRWLCIDKASDLLGYLPKWRLREGLSRFMSYSILHGM